MNRFGNILKPSIVFSIFLSILWINSCFLNDEGEYLEWDCTEYDCSSYSGGDSGNSCGGSTVLITSASGIILDGDKDAEYSPTYSFADACGDDTSGSTVADIANVQLLQDTTYLWIILSFCDGSPEANPLIDVSYRFNFTDQNSNQLGWIDVDYQVSNGFWTFGESGIFSSNSYSNGSGVELRIDKSQFSENVFNLEVISYSQAINADNTCIQSFQFL